MKVLKSLSKLLTTLDLAILTDMLPISCQIFVPTTSGLHRLNFVCEPRAELKYVWGLIGGHSCDHVGDRPRSNSIYGRFAGYMHLKMK